MSRVDIDRAGPTYTVDTLRDLHGQYPDAELFFITGADALAAILSWRDAHEALDLAHMVGVTRPGHDLSAAHLPAGIGAAWWRSRPWPSPRPIADCGLATVRRSAYLVPAGVERFIAKMGLYRSDDAAVGGRR